MTTTNQATEPRRRHALRGPIACVVATSGVLLGLIVDLVTHLIDSDHAETGIFDASNPGHLIAGLSLVALAGAVSLALADAMRFAPRRAFALAGCVAVVVAGGGVALASIEHTVGHRHGIETAARAPHEHGDDHGQHSPQTTASHGHEQLGEPDAAQVALVQRATAKYHDIEVAKAEGYRQENEDEPGQGAHFEHEGRSNQRRLDIAKPSFLMYSKRLTGSWQLVAVGYNVDPSTYPTPPTELTGVHWHQHNNSCAVPAQPFTEFVDGITEAECRARGGEFSPTSGFETHFWIWLPNPDGVSADENPLLR